MFLAVRASLYGMLRLFFRVRVEGMERYPAGAAVIVANHPSALDPLFILASLPERVMFVAAEEFLSWRAVGWAMRAYGCIPVRRGLIDPSAVRDALDLLTAGRKVGVFPEGQVSPRPGALHRGAGLLAAQAQVPLVPVAVLGTREVFPLGARWPRPGRVILRVGPHLPAPAPGRLSQDAAVSAAMTWIRAQDSDTGPQR